MRKPLIPAMLQILAEIKDVPPSVWQDPEQVKALASRLAQKLNVPVTEQQLTAMKNAFVGVTKNSKATDPVDVDKIVNKYGPKGSAAVGPLFKNLFKKPR